MWVPLVEVKVMRNCPSPSAETYTLTWQQSFFPPHWFYKLDCKLTSGSFQHGNSISVRSVCFSQIKYSSRYHVFWAGCYQRIDGAENEIRRSVMESWNSWKTARRRRNQPVWQHHQVLLYGNLSAQQLSTQHNGGHKHALYIHGFPCTVQGPSPYVSCFQTTLQRSRHALSSLLWLWMEEGVYR